MRIITFQNSDIIILLYISITNVWLDPCCRLHNYSAVIYTLYNKYGQWYQEHRNCVKGVRLTAAARSGELPSRSATSTYTLPAFSIRSTFAQSPLRAASWNSADATSSRPGSPNLLRFFPNSTDLTGNPAVF